MEQVLIYTIIFILNIRFQFFFLPRLLDVLSDLQLLTDADGYIIVILLTIALFALGYAVDAHDKKEKENTDSETFLDLPIDIF